MILRGGCVGLCAKKQEKVIVYHTPLGGGGAGPFAHRERETLIEEREYRMH